MARDPYEVVLADLRARRDEIDKLIRSLEAFRPAAPVPAVAAATAPATVTTDGPLMGLSILGAVARVLRDAGKPMGNAELAAAIQAGGLVMNSAEPANTVSSVLHRAHLAGNSELARVRRGVWGLAEWFQTMQDQVAEATDADDLPDDVKDLI